MLEMWQFLSKECCRLILLHFDVPVIPVVRFISSYSWSVSLCVVCNPNLFLSQSIFEYRYTTVVFIKFKDGHIYVITVEPMILFPFPDLDVTECDSLSNMSLS